MASDDSNFPKKTVLLSNKTMEMINEQYLPIQVLINQCCILEHFYALTICDYEWVYRVVSPGLPLSYS